ncbi:MAG: ABC transporter substrate-binding protein [Actinobacteria bacterium]|nr:ABC transporter substrate-binding protein [Actinomycetota bacterium]
MRRRTLAGAAALTTAALLLAGCTGTTGDQTIAETAPTELEGTVSFWHFFSDREADVIQSVIDDFEAANPKVTVDVHSGQDDEKLRKAIASGSDVDLGLSYSTDIVGNFCDSGAFRDLGPYIERDDVDLTQFSDTVRSYTEYNGVRCSMPVLADVYGLYYNTDLLSAAGYTEPPKTLSELEEMALKLTTYNADGSIKTLGFNPQMGFYENAASHYGPLAGATWLNDDGTSAVGSDPAWVELMTWQKSFVDEIGYDKLNAFTSGLGQEFSADNAFQTGQVAMNLDGEYRTAFIDDQTPDLHYATAPMPTADDHTDLYGAGYITGNIAGISKGSKNPELAWALLKYLTTDTDAIVKLSNGLKNVPTTADALASPDLEVTDQFATFLKIVADPNSGTTPPSPNGAGYQQSFEDFWHQYQSGDVPDLAAGLKDIDQQIDDATALTTGP